MKPIGTLARVRSAVASIFKAPPAGLRAVDDHRGWTMLFAGSADTSMTGWQKDIEVSHSAAMANWAVFSCMTLIAGDIGKVNWNLVEKDGGIWRETESASFSPLLRKPNHFQTRQQFIESWVLSKLGGNAYVLKQRDERRVVVAQYVLDPCRVYPLVAPNGDVYYQLQPDRLSRIRDDEEDEYVAVPASEIIHDRFNCLFHPLVGLSPIYACGPAAMQGLSIQQNSAKFFGNMSRPSGILTAPGAISQDTADRLKASWEANYGGNKIGKVAVLGDALKYEAMGVTAIDSQMVEQAKFSAEVICSTFHVPPFKIGVGTIPSGKVEDLNQIYYADCLHTLMDAIQTLQSQALGFDTPTEGRKLAVQFDLNDLLKMDTATLVATLANAIRGTMMKPNEARQRLNLPPVTGGDVVYSQQQNWSLEDLDARDGIPDAPSVAAPPAPPAEGAPDPNAPDPEALAFTYELVKGLGALEFA